MSRPLLCLCPLEDVRRSVVSRSTKYIYPVSMTWFIYLYIFLHHLYLEETNDITLYSYTFIPLVYFEPARALSEINQSCTITSVPVLYRHANLLSWLNSNTFGWCYCSCILTASGIKENLPRTLRLTGLTRWRGWRNVPKATDITTVYPRNDSTAKQRCDNQDCDHCGGSDLCCTQISTGLNSTFLVSGQGNLEPG